MSETPNQREANIQASQQIFDVWDGGDIDDLDEVVAEDVVLHGYPKQLRPTLHGREAFKTDDLRMMRTAFPDLFFEANEIVAADDQLMAYCTFGGTHDGELMGIEPTGKSVEVADFVWYRFEDGKLVEIVSLPDLFGLGIQLGIVQPPGNAPPQR